ncbi:MAG: DUF1501 domain-containing protein [candidate division WS1 bacterium]|nr:DUF1501 domain-containing protein [candidate division WS1 bacterium]
MSDRVSRRDAIRWMLWGATGLALSEHVPAFAQAAAPSARAKAVIQIWMWGGPPHTDTFDPKPNAGYDFTGPLDGVLDTNVPGIQVGELLPQLAGHADKYSIIRSMTHGNNGHETAAYIVQTGHRPGGRIVYPSLGAIVSLLKGYDGGYEGLVPPYVVLTQPQGRFDEAGFLGPRYKPFATGGDPNAQRFAVEGVVSGNITDEHQATRRDLLHTLDTLRNAMPGHGASEKLTTTEEKAYDMILGDAGKLFDLSTEDDALRQQYGRNTFGQSCLMARRLVEAGVPYVTINYGGWDTHKAHFETVRRKLPQMDAAMSTLLQDLTDRNLLDSTIVWWSGEFGRTPRVDWQPPWNGGRHHFGPCFSAVLAGGGFKGGQVVGASNETGERPAERPVYPADVLGSICQLLGIDPNERMSNSRGLDMAVMPPDEVATDSAGLLTEIM